MADAKDDIAASTTEPPPFWCHSCQARRWSRLTDGLDIKCAQCNSECIERIEDEAEPVTFEIPSAVIPPSPAPAPTTATTSSSTTTPAASADTAPGAAAPATAAADGAAPFPPDLASLLFPGMQPGGRPMRTTNAAGRRDVLQSLLGLTGGAPMGVLQLGGPMMMGGGPLDLGGLFGLGGLGAPVADGTGGGGGGGGGGVVGDYAFGDISALIHRLMMADQNLYGPPPTSKTVIERLPKRQVVMSQLNEANKACAVCQCEFEEGDETMTLPCEHFFHSDCILPWLEQHNTCPTCRREMPTDDDNYNQHKSLTSAEEFSMEP